MVQADVGDDGDLGVHDVGRVPASEQPDLDDPDVDRLVGEPAERGRGEHALDAADAETILLLALGRIILEQLARQLLQVARLLRIDGEAEFVHFFLEVARTQRKQQNEHGKQEIRNLQQLIDQREADDQRQEQHPARRSE